MAASATFRERYWIARIAPAGGILDGSGQGQDVVYGVVINHYEPFDRRGSGSLEDATEDLIGQVRRSSPYLQATGRPERKRAVDGARSLSVVLRVATLSPGCRSA